MFDLRDLTKLFKLVERARYDLEDLIQKEFDNRSIEEYEKEWQYLNRLSDKISNLMFEYVRKEEKNEEV